MEQTIIHSKTAGGKYGKFADCPNGIFENTMVFKMFY
jgi:hypothetical protein